VRGEDDKSTVAADRDRDSGNGNSTSAAGVPAVKIEGKDKDKDTSGDAIKMKCLLNNVSRHALVMIGLLYIPYAYACQ
jgi:hypothetical protein